jgi:serine/threonine protein phosphatase PrpC
LITRDITLIINPDPRSLWKNIATPETIEYYKPDEDKEFVKVVSKKVGGFLGIGKKEQARKDMVAASQRGRSHAHEGRARDDDFRLFFDESSEWHVMVVADGAGSAKYSRRGSQIACETVIDVCKEKINERHKAFELQISEFQKNRSDENRKKTGNLLYEIIGTATFQAYKNIEKEARQGKDKTIKDFSTTLLLSICKKFDFGWFTGAFWVGDGGIGIYNKETSSVKILGEPDSGEFAGQTRFLTMPEIMQPAEIYRRLRFEVLDDFTALILMTDGITDPKFETDANLYKIEKWNDLWTDLNGANEDQIKVDFSDANEQVADQLLQWLNFWSKGNHDDRTIAILF